MRNSQSQGKPISTGVAITAQTSAKPYGNQAFLYDHEYRAYTEDLPFYLSCLREYGVHSPVLELGVGTGRVAFPLAEAGYDVVGLERSLPMLRRARQRRNLAPPEVAERLQFLRRDVTRFQSPTRFGATLATFSFLCMLTTPELRHQCLRQVYTHLRPGGLLLVDVPRPHAPTPDQREVPSTPSSIDPSTPEPVQPRPLYTFYLPPYRHRVDKSVLERYDLDHMLLHVRYFYTVRRYMDDHVFRTLEISFTLAMLTPERLVRELAAAGFEVLEQYGDYRRGAPTPSSPRQVLVCQRREEVK